MAERAILGETRRNVVWVPRVVKRRQMAGDARRGRGGIVSAGMATDAVHGGVGSGQREAGDAVVELCPLPSVGTMAGGAVSRKVALLMIRVFGRIEGASVAAIAILRRPRKPTRRVAGNTVDPNVRSGQRERRQSVVIEFCTGPGGSGVADRTVPGEAGLHVIRVLCRIEVGGVATEAVRRSPRESAAGMAARAIDSSVCPGKFKSRQERMVELCPAPRIHAMARLAVGRKLCRRVIQDPRGLVISQMARDTVGPQAGKLPDRRALVAGLAVYGGVRSDQGKPVLVARHGLHRDTPAPDRVALLALCSELPPVNVRVTIGAIHPHIGEHELRVAKGAWHRLMEPAEREARFLVGEIQYGPKRFPAGGGVTILARNGERAMGTTDAPPLSLSPQSYRPGQN